MIRICNASDYEDIIRIWKNAFGDNREYILNFLDKFSHFVYIMEKDAIMTLLPVTLDGKKGHYVYAVAVDENKRSNGLGKKLIEFAKEIKEDFLVLVPANQGLFEYYQKLGFSNNSDIGIFDCADTSTEISASEYFILRDKLLKNYIKWSKENLTKIAELYGAKFYKNKESTEISMMANKRIIEIIGKNPIEKKPFSMIYPEKYKNSYFNIAID